MPINEERRREEQFRKANVKEKLSNIKTFKKLKVLLSAGNPDNGSYTNCVSCVTAHFVIGSVLPRECSEIKGDNLANGVHNIYPDRTAAAVQVYCDMVTENGAWTELRIEMTDFDGNFKYAEYRVFGLGDEIGGYPLLISSYTGTSGDSLYHTIHSHIGNDVPKVLK
ncbi:unnamed protein product [Mytilus coruscus]|uniref:Fibrinogen C-terminal domain-containing protein n=1 Tax=Mytilus coruscus TaxID=42192 RepID=A0A6J8D441_MYTCO|nr:unnamed protein product [Mytilus coruscus]